MKALQCVELGMPDKLQVNEVPEPELLDGHVIIENKACSINFPDVLMIQGLYQFNQSFRLFLVESLLELFLLLARELKALMLEIVFLQ